MIVLVTQNMERIGWGPSNYVLDTDKLKNYKPITNDVPSNVVDILENKPWIDIMSGNEPDWFGDELENMIKEGIVVEVTENTNKIDREFEIAYC
jgi:hypothetical protein